MNIIMLFKLDILRQFYYLTAWETLDKLLNLGEPQ